MDFSQKNWNIALIVLLAITLLVSLLGYFSKEDKTKNVISMTGIAEMKVSPDLFKVSFSVNNKSNDLKKSSSLSSAQSKELIQKIKDLHIDEKNIKTVDMRTSEVWQSYEDKSKPKEYEAIESIEVEIKDDVNKLNQVLDLVKKFSANSVFLNDVSASVSDDNKDMKKLNEEAFQNAREKAEHYAEIGGFKLRKVVGVAEKSNDNFTPRNMLAKAKPVDAAMPESSFESGDESIRSEITVSWEIS